MKDIIITEKRRKKEFQVLLICFIAAFLINVLAVLIYKTPWHEIFTQIGYVLVITVVLYLITALVRWLIYLFTSKIFRKDKRSLR